VKASNTILPAVIPHRGWRRGVLLVVVSALVGCTSTAQPATGPSPLRAQLVEDVAAAGSAVHIEALQRIADANGGNRASPGRGYDASVDYVAQVLRDAGFDVTTPSVTLDGSDVAVRNVIAQTRTGSAEHVVLVGAHLDSVPEGPGADDNASGVAALLEIAVRMGGSPSLPNAVRFGFWAAEERSFEGSVGYVDSLSRSDRDGLAVYLNVDMVASPNAGYFVQGGVGEAGSEAGPPGSDVVGRVLAEELAAVGVVAEHVEFEGGSDYVPFIEAGIPTGGVLSGDEDTKTSEQAERWGGTEGEEFDPCYHAACDRAEGIDRTALDRFGDALAGTVVRFAESPRSVTG
jgi:aminopeptidase S